MDSDSFQIRFRSGFLQGNFFLKPLESKTLGN